MGGPGFLRPRTELAANNGSGQGQLYEEYARLAETRLAQNALKYVTIS